MNTNIEIAKKHTIVLAISAAMILYAGSTALGAGIGGGSNEGGGVYDGGGIYDGGNSNAGGGIYSGGNSNAGGAIYSGGNSNAGGGSYNPPGLGSKSVPIYRINHIHDTALSMDVGTVLSPYQWQVQQQVDWNGSPFQPCRIAVLMRGPKGESIAFHPTWVPTGPGDRDCILSSPQDIAAVTARVAGIPQVATYRVIPVSQFSLAGGGLNYLAFAVVLKANVGNQDVCVCAGALTTQVQGGLWTVISLTPIVAALPQGQLERNMPAILSVISSLRVNQRWLYAYMKITLPNASIINEAVGAQTEVYDKTNAAWGKYVNGLSTYTLSSGVKYNLPFANTYAEDYDTIHVRRNGEGVPDQGTILVPDPL